MPVFDHPEFDQHELLHFVQDPETGLKAIIAIHSTALGPAAGGCRRWQYASDRHAVTDALRLSRGMTYKNAVAGLKFGGGKSVILASDDAPKTPELFHAFGRVVEGPSFVSRRRGLEAVLGGVHVQPAAAAGGVAREPFRADVLRPVVVVVFFVVDEAVRVDPDAERHFSRRFVRRRVDP